MGTSPQLRNFSNGGSRSFSKLQFLSVSIKVFILQQAILHKSPDYLVLGSRKRTLQESFSVSHNQSLTFIFGSTEELSINLLLNSLQMQFNQTKVTDGATVQANKPTEQMYNNQVFLQTSTPFLDSPADWDAMLHPKSVESLQQEIEKTVSNLYSKGHQSTRMPLTTRREKNRERERKRQKRLKEAFNVLRSVIPDYFSEREPGDRLSRIQTLRLAKEYIATLHELLETS